MILKIYSVYDSKTEAFLQPFYMQAKGQAIRAFTDAVSGGNEQFSKHPEDFTLFELGSFDDSGARFDLYKTPQSLGLAVEFLKPGSRVSEKQV